MVIRGGYESSNEGKFVHGKSELVTGPESGGRLTIQTCIHQGTQGPKITRAEIQQVRVKSRTSPLLFADEAIAKRQCRSTQGSDGKGSGDSVAQLKDPAAEVLDTRITGLRVDRYA